MDSKTVYGSNNKEIDALDELFAAIQSQSTDVARILNLNPELCNMKSDPKNAHGDMSGRDFLEAKMFGYLSTPDIIQYHKEGAKVPEVQPSSQRPLHVACLFENHEAIKTLLAFPRTDLNAKNGDGETALGVACRAGCLPIAKLLLQESANSTGQREAIWLDSADNSGTRPIRYLTRETPSARHNPAIQELADLLSSEAFDRYMKGEKLEIRSPWLLKLLNDKTGDDDWTPLHYAVARGDFEVVRLLLKAGKSTQHERISGENPFGWDAQAFAEELGETEIARMIKFLCSSESRVEPPDFLDGRISFKPPNESARKPGQKSGYEELPISKLIKKSRSVEYAGVNWHHLPANNWRWLQLMLDIDPKRGRDESLLKHIEKKFELSRPMARGRDFFIGHNPTSLPELDKTKNNQGRSGAIGRVEKLDPEPELTGREGSSSVSPSDSYHALSFSAYPDSPGAPGSPGTPPGSGMSSSPSIDDAKSLMTVLPVIDIDLLDGYADPTRNLSRFEASLLDKSVTRLYKYSDYDGLLPSRTLDHYYQDDLDCQAQSKLNESQVFTRYLEQMHYSDGNQPRRILVVSQFWLLRSNNSLVTSFPKRRGIKTKDQKVQLSEVIKRVFDSTRDPKIIYHDMIKKAMQYQPWTELPGKRTTYLEIFQKEVQRISRQTDECYDDFKQTLGVSEKHFKRLSNNATTCLLDIDDVLSEVNIIQRVLNDRKRVWRQFHTKKFNHGLLDNDSDSEDGYAYYGRPLPRSCRWGVRNCKPNVVEASLRSDFLEVQRTAEAVGEKAHGLVTLLHGQASTENALTASKQAKYLLIFTLLTVVFSPLSFVTSLLALQVESFTPTEWAQRDVIVACIVSVITTGILCALPYCWMKCGKRRCKRLYEAVLKPYWQRLMACAHDLFKKGRRGDGDNIESRHIIASICSICSIWSDRPRKASDDAENGTA